MLKLFATWFLIFMFYSFAGWLMEVVISLFSHRKFINRGFLVGPVCPIYGTGAVLLSLILSNTESPLVIFCVAMVGGAIIEYVASWLMEVLFRVRWWDYSEKTFNVNGRICLESILSFGVFGIIILKFTTPFFLALLAKLSDPVLYLLAGSLFVWMIFDICLSLWLILDVRVTVGTVQRDATDEISERVRAVLMDKGKLNRRLVKAFPNQSPTQKTRRKKPKTPTK